MVINDAETILELTDVSSSYEKALVENDVETMTRLFWSSEYVTRFGVSENLYGADEIKVFRNSRPTVGLAREVVRQEVVAFGKDYGSVTVEFSRGTVRGRQSQIWVKFEEGWRIVAAHVSLLAVSSDAFTTT